VSDDYLDRDPGFYISDDGSAFALVEQQRASIIDALRVTKAASVTMFDPDGGGRHWGVYIDDDDDAESFMVYAAVRAIRDAAAALGVDDASACRLVLAAIAKGVGQ
jgi:hypothetical protein